MKFLLLLVTLWALLKTVARRVMLGAMHRAWTWQMELVQAGMRAALVWAARRSPATWRAILRDMDTSRQQFRSVTLEPVDAGGVPGTWFLPPDSSASPVVLYLHGGGYVMGNVETHRDSVNRIARGTGFRVLFPDYRLAPEHPHPAALEDAVKAYRFLLEGGTAPGNILLCGDSAGGGLSLALLVHLRDTGLPLPRGAACLSPWTDLCATGASVRLNDHTDYLPADELVRIGRMYAGEHDPAHPLLSPLNADHAGLPELYVQAGDAEILLDDARRLAERARAAGVKVTLDIIPAMFHVPSAFSTLCEGGRTAMASVVSWMRGCFVVP